MGLFSKLMGEESAQPAVRLNDTIRPLAAEAKVIGYDAELVDRLKAEHQDLLHAFTAIQQSGERGHFARLPEQLEQFRLALLNHIAMENVKFYVYMQHHPALDEAAQGFIAGVRKEMNTIARAVAKFVDSHLADTPTYATVDRFTSELDHIGKVLAERITLEESHLYSLYRP